MTSVHTPPIPSLGSSGFAQNTHQHYAWMRAHAPVSRVHMTGRTHAYLVTRYDDVSTVLRDGRLVKDVRNSTSGSGSMPWVPKAFRPLMSSMLNSDEPDHRRLRNLVHKAFTPRRIDDLEGRIESIAGDLLVRVDPDQPVDLVRAFALPLPVTVIAEMIGIPIEDRARFFGWTSRVVATPTPVNMMRSLPSLNAMIRYLRRLADRRRHEPADDLLTALVQAADDHDGAFTADELIAMLFLLLVAGHETTVGLIANGTAALLDHPDQLELVRSEPGLLEPAVEEMLRFDGPLQTTEMSFARDGFEMHGVHVPSGALVLPAILSANRDESAFADADRFDVTRSPNRHLAFGQGIHYCLGAPLARLEANVAFRVLLERAPGLRLAVPAGDLRYVDVVMIHRLRALPVRLR